MERIPEGTGMKSFDEVTKALSICGRHPDCKGCSYENISYPTEIGNTCKDIMHYDALHYLKTIETTENLYHDAVNELSKWINEDWKDRCLPLTWDELREMKGKPVWIETDSEKFWTVIDNFRIICNQECLCCSKGYMCRSTYTRGDWQAYRKERN